MYYLKVYVGPINTYINTNTNKTSKKKKMTSSYHFSYCCFVLFCFSFRNSHCPSDVTKANLGLFLQP